MTAALKTVYKCPDGTEFPVDWTNPEDEKLGWFWDQMHSPLPITPLSAHFSNDIGIGFGRAMATMGVPMSPAWVKFHGFNFISARPRRGDMAQFATLMKADEERRAPQLLELWTDEYGPECRALTRSIRSRAAEVDLTRWEDIFADMHALIRRLGEIHHLVMQPISNAASAFIAVCKSEFGPEGGLIATDLMGGFPNRSLDSANGLWELAETAKSLPEVEALLRANSPSRFLEQLEAVRGGSEFWTRLDTYLDEFGHRNESFNEFSFPTWREEPKFPLFMVRRYLDAPPEKSPAAMNRAVEERRMTRLADVMPRLGDEQKRDEFERLMRIAQQRTVLIEDHNFYIDQQTPAAGRAVCLAFGARLAARGAIESAADIFFLEEEEVLAVADKSEIDYRAVVAARRAEHHYWTRKLPPASIGQGPVRMPAQMEEFFGPVANEPMEAGAFKGVAGSAGLVRGTARLILSLDDVDRLAPGEILVTYATAPPWTPAFAIAGGIVTDIGGTLSHCAVVAREYGIPAVVGTRVATATIQDGQLITVDGTNGIVRIEDAG